MEDKKMKTQHIEVTGGGLKCDNPECDWKDVSIPFTEFKGWINKPCPSCGENVLTEQDYQNAESLMMAVDITNGGIVK